MKYVLAGVLLASVFATTPALATPGSGFVPSGIVNGHFGSLDVKTESDKTDKWGMILKTKDETDMGVDRLSVAAGGFSGWHAHPGPVFVTVLSGTIIWYDGSDPLAKGSGAAGMSVRTTGSGRVLSLPVPLVAQDDVRLARKGDELVVSVASYRRLLTLPSGLARHRVAGARVHDGELQVRFTEPAPESIATAEEAT